MENNITLETKLVGEISGDFFVPSYQRGYRWGKDEVTRLLEDIYQNGEAIDGKSSYCLQPIVVRKNGDRFELIDGQQRLTTLYLIYKFLQDASPFFGEPAFSLTYETREESAQYLKEIDFAKREDNIDFWFIANAFEVIENWFAEDLQIKSINFFKYLKESVKVIWYEIASNEDAISLFTRLNIGRIPLTSAELVKALFLSSGDNLNIDRRKQEEISLQWDAIERELHDESLWYFLTNASASQYPTRIDLVLDLMSQKGASRDKYFTFFYFDKLREVQNLDDIWRKIQETFLIMKDWRENHELYHKIGYLIASGDFSLQDIYDLARDKKKDEFRNCLDDAIASSINLSGKNGSAKNYGDLSYETDADKISKLLLLFNVESVRQNGEETQWFPFDKYKFKKGGSTTWSLEHIHAQRSEGLNKREAQKEWLSRHLRSIESLKATSGDDQQLDQILVNMKKAIEDPDLKREDFEEIQSRVFDRLSAKGSIEYMHSISNLALLDSGDNAALSNSTFDVKRNQIIDMDRKGQYIPFCTKMVFLKYYTPSEESQLHFWGQSDRIAYINAINAILGGYLEEKIYIEEVEA